MTHNRPWLYHSTIGTGTKLSMTRQHSLACPTASAKHCSRVWSNEKSTCIAAVCERSSLYFRPAEESVPTASRAYAVYFNTLPVHLWGRAQRGGSGAIGQDSRDSRALQAPARRVRHAWSQVALVPGQEGEVIFVQGWSPRVLLTTLPKVCASVFAVCLVLKVNLFHLSVSAVCLLLLYVWKQYYSISPMKTFFLELFLIIFYSA